MRLGLEKEGWKVKFANDIDPSKYVMYLRHFGEKDGARFTVGDIHKLSADAVPSVTLATASFPCNDLSLAGMRDGLGGKQSSAFWGFIRILEEMGRRKPPIVLLENVAGFLSSHGGKDFQAAMLALNKLGYAVDALMIDAERFVPQSRVRLFVIGTRDKKELSSAASDESLFYGSDVRPAALAEYIFRHPEINWCMREMSNLPERTIGLTSILEDLPEASDFWWSEDRVKYLISQMSSKHAKQLNALMKEHNWSYGTVFRRIRNARSMAELRTDGIAGCLRTPRGGSGRQILIKAGYKKCQVRLLTPRECARLMGADDYLVDVPLNQALFGFGDAVCVPVIQWIAQNYLEPLIRGALEDA